MAVRVVASSSFIVCSPQEPVTARPQERASLRHGSSLLKVQQICPWRMPVKLRRRPKFTTKSGRMMPRASSEKDVITTEVDNNRILVQDGYGFGDLQNTEFSNIHR